jgi:epoxyqueuosine reductase
VTFDPAASDTSPSTLVDRVKSLARALGFDLVGVADPAPGDDTRFFREWVRRGYAGEMDYLVRRQDEREDPSKVLDGIRSVVVLALAYEPPSQSASRRVASYAGGEDYHELMIDRVRAVAAGIEALAPDAVMTRGYVDTGPVLERVFAARAGLGWLGKNTCLIDTQLGSRLLLGVVLTDLALPFDSAEPDHCGTCRACLDACPTQAFPDPYLLDATRCISYTTIETRGPIPLALRAGQGEWIFGCDICQDVCPWNRRPQPGDLPDPLGLRERLEQPEIWAGASLEWVLGLDIEAWREATRGTALRRAKHRGLLRSALVAAGNRGDAALRAAVERHAEGSDAMLAEHARWALTRFDSRG